jgi:hypothetical protein
MEYRQGDDKKGGKFMIEDPGNKKGKTLNVFPCLKIMNPCRWEDTTNITPASSRQLLIILLSPLSRAHFLLYRRCKSGSKPGDSQAVRIKGLEIRNREIRCRRTIAWGNVAIQDGEFPGRKTA